ncbi:globin-coupled sensor protein [Bacillus sp. B-jedd]|uniref:globin-coupled sensor protein n=1 Tax=Bacillus sp. B-jedd TaxID=1476857 RepID=UPI0005156A0B|nr:globin-coupled sensor protein [Bacillus sp. B-jedd]CEG28937.1 putative heme-based aerotactic transducer (MCP) [Bacillus sp. B-jedd]
MVMKANESLPAHLQSAVFSTHAVEEAEINVILKTEDFSDLSNQLAMIQLNKRDLAHAKLIQPFVKEHLEAIAINYYAEIQKEASLLKIIKDHSTVDRLRETLKKHIYELFDGKIDEGFILQRNRIAHVHVRIGLKTKWYMAAFQSLFTTIITILEQKIVNKNELIIAINVVAKLLNLEQQLVLEAYEQENERIKQEEQRKKKIHERIAQTAEELSAVTEQTSASVNSLAEKTDNMVDMSVAGVKSAKEVESRSLLGLDKIQEHLSQINNISEHTNSINCEMDKLKNISNKIDEVANIVKKIADTTHILGMNATIEAAHAGKSGAGFSVIANEVKKLAAQTQKNVADVSILVTETHAQISTVANMNIEVSKLVHNGMRQMSEITEFFTRILSEIQMTKEQTGQMEKELVYFATYFEEINRAVSHLASTADVLTQILADI